MDVHKIDDFPAAVSVEDGDEAARGRAPEAIHKHEPVFHSVPLTFDAAGSAALLLCFVTVNQRSKAFLEEMTSSLKNVRLHELSSYKYLEMRSHLQIFTKDADVCKAEHMCSPKS